MNAVDEKRIELSKVKVLLLALGSLAFVALGALLISLDSSAIAAQLHGSLLYVHGIGLVSIDFFGLTGISSLKKLFDTKPGLVLKSFGIVDNSSAVAAGFVSWAEISGAEIIQIHRQKILSIKLKDPQKYIERANKLKQILNKASYKRCGGPIAITSSTLKIGFADLISIFNQYHQKYGQP